MPLEPGNGTTIGNINPNWPIRLDQISQGNDHIQVIKRAMKNSFVRIGETPMELTAEEWNEAYNRREKIGLVRMWDGYSTELPIGWQFCDGLEYYGYTTPNLEDTFIKGKGNEDDVFTPGGVKEYIDEAGSGHALTIPEMPAHGHTYQHFSQSDNDAGLSGSQGVDRNPHYTETTSSSGSNTAHAHNMSFDNEPDYYTLAFIAFVGFPIQEPPSVSPKMQELDESIPTPLDFLEFGDDNMREIKGALQNSFPLFRDNLTLLTPSQIEESYRMDREKSIVEMYFNPIVSIPNGYTLCNLDQVVNGVTVPDLRDRFIKFAADAGNRGGEDSTAIIDEGHALTIEEMGPHSHTGPNHSNATGEERGSLGAGAYKNTVENKTTSPLVGGGEKHYHTWDGLDNKPPYDEIYYIIYTGGL
jgi:hypothetical protein